jgi:hypothetical protein
MQIDAGLSDITILLDQPLRIDDASSELRAEQWFVWQAEAPLVLSEPPELL